MSTPFSIDTALARPRDTQDLAGFRTDVLDGLTASPKTLPCRYLYDAEGSRLFERICELEEYYPTRTEIQILHDHIQEICALCGPECLLLELGSGSSTKTRLLLNGLSDLVGYVPIDIAEAQLQEAASTLRADYPELEILPICGDYHKFPALPETSRVPARRVTFFPGSTIGNFAPPTAREFLARLAVNSQPGDALLVGVDLQKPRRILEEAYNDSLGVTAAFNLNLLRRINRELGANFDLVQFRHQAIYNYELACIEMHLVSLRLQTVQCGGESFPFDKGEYIISEHSYKYTLLDFTSMALDAGYKVIRAWTDPRHWFAVIYLAVA